MENIKRLFFDADDVAKFIYSAAHGITDGKAGCHTVSLFFDGGAYEWMKSEKPFPVPLFMDITEIGHEDDKEGLSEDEEKVLSELPKILESDSGRVKQYLDTIVPFFDFGSGDNYVITEQGLVVKPSKEILTPSQVQMDAHAGWYNDDIKALVGFDTYMAVKKANHHRFFKRFCPWYFENNPDYAKLTPKEKSLVGEYAREIRDINPISSRELEELVK